MRPGPFGNYFRLQLPLEDRANVGDVSRTYANFNPGYALADLTVTQRFSPQIEALLQIQNVGDHYAPDYSARGAAIGRLSKLGVRLRF